MAVGKKNDRASDKLRIISKILPYHTFEYFEAKKMEIYLSITYCSGQVASVLTLRTCLSNYNTQVQTAWGFSGMVEKDCQKQDCMAAIAVSQGLFSPADLEQASKQCHFPTPAITVIFMGGRTEFMQILHFLERIFQNSSSFHLLF